jgi:hypothetical protein
MVGERNEELLRIYGTEIELGAPIVHARYERPFLAVVGIDDLIHSVVNGLSESQLALCTAALLGRADTPDATGPVIQIFVYVASALDSSQEVNLDETAGFSLVMSTDSGLQHAYHERAEDGRFSLVGELSGTLEGIFDADDIRLIHFAAVGTRPLPKRSTILELNSGSWARRDFVRERNTRLRWSLLADPSRSQGARSLGLYSSTLFRMVAGEDGERCGSDEQCPVGKKSCSYPPGGPEKVCNLPEPQGDIFVDAERAVVKADPSKSHSIDFALVRAALDRLELSEVGRRIISAWYRLGLFFRTDSEMLPLIERLLPRIQAALRTIVEGNDDDILIDDELVTLVRDVVRAHRNVADRELQHLLDEIERSQATWAGVRRTILTASPT